MDFVDGAMFSRIPSSGGELNLTSFHSVSPKHDEIRRNNVKMDYVDGALFSRIPSSCGELNMSSYHSASPNLDLHEHDDIRRRKPPSMSTAGNRNSAPCQQNQMDESYSIKRQTVGLLQAAPVKQLNKKVSNSEISDIVKNKGTKTYSSSLSNFTSTDIYSPQSSSRIHKQPKYCHKYASSNPTIKITESVELDPCLDRNSLSPTLSTADTKTIEIADQAGFSKDSSNAQLSPPAGAVFELEIDTSCCLNASDTAQISESLTTPNSDANCASKRSSTFYVSDDEVIDQQVEQNPEGTCNERTSTHLYPRLCIADEAGGSDNCEPKRDGLDHTDSNAQASVAYRANTESLRFKQSAGEESAMIKTDESPKRKPLKIFAGLLFPIISLLIYIWDIGSDIKLAISYKENGDIGLFWITLACIVIPLVLMSIMDVSWVWIDGSTCSTSSVIRYLLGVLTLGRIVRAILYMQHLVKGEILSSREYRTWHRKRALEEKRDCLMLDFINAFAESVPQLFVQLYLLYALNLDLTVLRVLNLLSSWISIAWTYAAYYRCNKEALAGTQDVKICAFLIFFLSVLAALSARVMCIVLFLVFFETWIGVVVLSVHFLATLLWILLKEKPTFEGTTSSAFGRFLYRVFFSYVSVLCFVNLRNTRARYRITCFYVVLYIENCTIAAFTLHRMLTYSDSGSGIVYNLLALPIGLVFHVILLLLYYQALHPKTGSCFKQRIGEARDL